MNLSFKKLALINVSTLALAIILILLERFFGEKLFWFSFAAIAIFVLSMLWTVILFLIRAFK